MTTSDSDLKRALRAYALAAFDALGGAGWSLPPTQDRGGGWQHAGDGDFFLRPMDATARLLPFGRGPQPALPEYRACIEALKAHSVIGPRLNTLVGSVMGAARLEMDEIPDRLLIAMLRDAPDLTFDGTDFDRSADTLIAWLTRSVALHTTIAPLPGITVDRPPVALGPGVEIDEMSDAEVIDCLTVGILGGGGMMGYAVVQPRVALRIQDELPLRVGDLTEGAEPINHFEGWRDLAEQVVFALRLLKPGNVWSPGLVSRSDMIPGARGGNFTPSATARYLPTRGYQLADADGPALASLWTQMDNPRVKQCLPLTTAIRRFGFAGERVRPEDQIIDLMIAAEALFLPGDQGESRHKLSLRAAILLEDTDHAARDIATEMRRAYDARSKLAHGGSIDALKLKRPTGEPATLPDYVGIAGDHLRNALRRVIRAVAETGCSPMDDWDGFVFDRLRQS